MIIRQVLPALLACLAATATAADRFWDGGDATSNMSAAANWNGNIAINAGDELVFPPGLALADKTVTNNFAPNTAFSGLQFLDGGYTFNGTIMGISGGVIGSHNAGTTVFNASLSLLDTISFGSHGTGSFSMGAASQIFLNGFALNTYGSVTFGGSLAGSGNISLWDAAAVSITGAKNFTANMNIRQNSTLTIDNAGGLGTGTGLTDLIDGTLVLNSVAALSIPESIRMSNVDPATSRIRSLGGAHTLSGPIAFAGDHFKRFEVEGTSLTFSGSITGPNSFGSMTKTGSGQLILSGATSNTAGIQIFSTIAGEVLLNKSGGATAISSPFILLGSNALLPHNAILRLGASHQIADATQVDLGSDGWFDLNGQQETVASLEFRGSGHVTGNGGTLRIDEGVYASSAAQNGGEAVIDGAITLSAANSEWEVNGGASVIDLTVNGAVTSLAPGGTLTKTGAGMLEINGNVAVPLLEVTNGHLTLAGTSPATDLDCHGLSANLTGTAGDVTISGGSLSIGSVANPTRQTLQCGNLSMANGSTYLMMTASVATTDAIIVTGTVTLNQPTLGVPVDILEPQPIIGEELVIMENDGTDPVTGSFAGYPEGAIWTNLPSETFVVSYQGGDGNDVSLTRIIAPTGVTRLWDGGGADNNWMTPNNWNPNGQPQPGDDLVFPTVASRKANLNNFPADTTFNSITVQGTGYDLGGNGITLNEKVEFTSASGSHFLSLPITLALDATISVTGNGYVEADAPIDLNGHKLTLHNAGGGVGDLVMSGVISGNSVNSTVSKTGTGMVTWHDVSHTYLGATHVQFGSLVLRASATLGNSGGGTTIDLRLDGIIYGTGFDKTGTGRVDIMAGIPLDGLDLLNLQQGSAFFFNNSRFTDIHLNGGLLGGNGTVGNLSSIAGGNIAPGASPGVLGGNIATWNGATTLNMELNGLNPGADHDQYFVNGQLNLGGATLALSAGFDPAPGAEFMIVRNVGGYPIIGTFASIPENGYVSAPGGIVFQVTYIGGAGDDVVLTRVEVDAPHVVSYSMFPGLDENEGKKGHALTVHGTPGLNYQLETSTDLQTWTKRQLVKADLQTGLMLFEFFNPETDPKLFLRGGLP